MDYSNSHVVTLDQYLVVLKQKTMDKKFANEIKELKAKEKGKRKSRKVENTLTQAKKTIQRRIEKNK